MYDNSNIKYLYKYILNMRYSFVYLKKYRREYGN